MTSKTSTQRILAYVDSPLMQINHKISGITGTKFTKFLALCNFFIDGVNATIRDAIRPAVAK